MDLYTLSLIVMVFICSVLVVSLKSSSKPLDPTFKKFQAKYLSVVSLVYLGDWLQGSYQYPLFKQAGYSLDYIALFFVVGFSSSAVFGTIVGSFADRFGRKNGALLFCVLYAICCFTKVYPNLYTIVIGRILGGISTSLLFSVFESWMISSHNSQGFDSSLLSVTFQWQTFLNGLVAIISGILANVSVDSYGLVAPFILAGSLMIPTFFMIQLTWTENYGKQTKGDSKLDVKSKSRSKNNTTAKVKETKDKRAKETNGESAWSVIKGIGF